MRRRWTGGAAVLAVTLGGLVATAGPAAAAPPVRCDFDGDGSADLAIGVPGEDGRGAVNVQYATGPGFLQERWLPAGSAFGAALTCGDFDADGIGDLAVAAPLAYDGQGKVFVYAGRDGSGLPASATSMFSQGGTIPGEYEDDDRLGWSLAAGDVDDNGYDDLVVGVPGDRDAEGRNRPGSVVVVDGGWKGLRFDGTAEQLFGWTEADDGKEFHTPPAFGWSVASAG